MNINIEQWHANIGLFNLNYKGIISKNCTCMNTVNYKIIILLFMLITDSRWYWVEPWTTRKISSYFSLCHWDANSILAHNKLSLLTAYYITYKYYILCVSETYLIHQLIQVNFQFLAMVLFELIIQMTKKSVGFEYTLEKT